MKGLIKQLQQNKGVSLMEVLVSVAISMIVMVVAATFISNGSIFFKKQSKTIDVQNELMEVSNKINDSLMQSTKELEINTGAGANGAKIYTGQYDINTKKFVSGKGSARYIEWNSADGTVYVMDVLEVADEDLKKGYLMGSHVTSITVNVAEDCKLTHEGTFVGYEQPLILEVSVTVAKDDEIRSDSRIVTLRNELDKLIINGVTYTPNADDLLTKN